MTMPLEALSAADLPSCHALFQASVRALAGTVYTEEQCAVWAPARGWDEEIALAWQARLADAWSCKEMAADGRMAGFAWLKRDGEFDMLYVAPWAARRGLGGRMIVELERQATAAGVNAYYVWASHASRPVFERAAYRLLRPNRIIRQGVAIDNWLLAKGGWREEES
ncbi:GNAT family N-acetyltransferase [Chromobacterium sinusclupearum]|uniref:GNAT family N-acetyltransferase n=1 Tax=Chromobacterium sinusclupearum TaxID=2077146 RepID=A0A2K4MHZ1_9NEIS|nr:GNAT family N-acetyltransferase [Chromobacterium sinusclupearum]POA96693.1 GNAT family N-acetyltransferase [Chromobacterium sinusclupearum]